MCCAYSSKVFDAAGCSFWMMAASSSTIQVVTGVSLSLCVGDIFQACKKTILSLAERRQNGSFVVHDWSATTSIQSGTLTIDGKAVSASSSVRDLGIHIDADLVMRTHVQKTVSRCFAVLRLLHQIRRSVPQHTFQSLMIALVNSRLDYGNSALKGLTLLTRRLQSVLNAAAWLIFNLRRSDHFSDAIISLHWLRVPGRIRSKVAVLVYKVLHGCVSSYLGLFTYVADLPSPRGLCSSCSDCLIQPPVHRSTVSSRAFSVAGF